MTLRQTLFSALLLSLTFTGNVYAETVEKKFERAYQYAEQQNYQAAFPIFKELAEQGHGIAQFNLGLMYDNGFGVKQDSTLSFKWYQKAAEQKVAVAQSNLAAMYYTGTGVEQDKAKAKYYYGLACENGDKFGCDNYRNLNELGY